MKANHHQSEQYVCPMKCEGEKTYDHPGRCPVCNMFLILLEETVLVQEDIENKPSYPAHNHTHDSPHMEKGKKEDAVPKGDTYTCPMHPEIKSKEPGICPKCGMDLIPVVTGKQDKEEQAWHSMARKFWWALIFTTPVAFIAMGDMIPGIRLENIMPLKYWNWVQLLFSLPVIFYAGRGFFKRGWASVVRRSPNMGT